MDRTNDFDTYQEWALSKMSDATSSDDVQRLLTAALGTMGESGELLEEMLPAIIAALAVKSSSFADNVKKIAFHGHQITDELRAKLKKELGDTMWYIAIGAHALGLTLSDVAQGNVEKLDARYPNGFTPERSLHRPEGVATGIGAAVHYTVKPDRSEYPNGFTVPQPPKQVEAQLSINPDDPRHGYGAIADPNERQAQDVRSVLENKGTRDGWPAGSFKRDWDSEWNKAPKWLNGEDVL